MESIIVKNGDNIIYPFGKKVKGILFYSEKYMSVQMMMPVKYPITSEQKQQFNLEELAQTLKSAGYLGTSALMRLTKKTKRLFTKSKAV